MHGQVRSINEKDDCPYNACKGDCDTCSRFKAILEKIEREEN